MSIERIQSSFNNRYDAGKTRSHSHRRSSENNASIFSDTEETKKTKHNKHSEQTSNNLDKGINSIKSGLQNLLSSIKGESKTQNAETQNSKVDNQKQNIQAAQTTQATKAVQQETPVNNTNNETSGISGWADPQKALNTPAQSKQVALEYMNRLQQDFGLTKEQAAGVVGNLWHESGMNSGIRQETGGIGQPNMATDVVDRTGYGIAQWGESRKQGLIDYAKANGLDPSSQAANYGFLKQELSGPNASAIAAVKASNSMSEATQAFMNEFEKPSDPQLNSRLNYAQQILNL
jgi:hypothetical protein